MWNTIKSGKDWFGEMKNKKKNGEFYWEKVLISPITDENNVITHFVGVSWGPVIPAGEAMIPVEAAKGSNGYYLISDGSTSSYRSRIRTPSFPHMQMLPFITKGYTIPDLLAILGAMDFVLADLDR